MNQDYNNNRQTSQQYQQPPQQYQQPPQQYYQQPYVQSPYGAYMPENGTATASLVCGILSLILLLAGLILGIVAIATGASAQKKGNRSGKATAGIVMGIIGTTWNALYLIALIIGLISLF